MRYLLYAILFIAGTWVQEQSPQKETEPVVAFITVDGSITPTTTNYIKRGIRKAREMQAECLVIELDTPGGLLVSTKNIVQALLDSDNFPVVVYVAPEGATAASAGTFITMAAHIAAMAPATNIGAASPVRSTPGGGTVQQDTVMQKKLFNYAESYIETIANRRDRNAKWAVSAVRDGESVTSREALDLNVIDLIADNRADLLKKLDGRKAAGTQLETTGATIREIPNNLAEKLLGIIIRPEVMLILTMIAIYGIIGEVTNPGAIIPGVAGVIALILLLFASAAMPINIAGFALIGLAIVLFIAEAFTPTFGLLIGGGAVAFFLGSLMLFQDLPESMDLSWAWLIPATLFTVLFFVWIVGAGIKIQFTHSRTGKETMLGKQAEVVDKIDKSSGRIFINGEYWNAISEEDVIPEGEWCEIVDIQGLTVRVRSLRSSSNVGDLSESSS